MADKLVDMIYEAAVVTDLWPQLLDSLARQFGSRGGLLFASSEHGVRWLAGGDVNAFMEEFLDQGWMAHNLRPALAMAKRHPGFLNELDYMTEEETIELPMFKQFLRPHGFFATAGTSLHGLSGDLLNLSLEGFADHSAARAAIPGLDQLRPHLARAMQLAGQFRLERMRGHVEALETLGVAACVLGSRGTLRATNARFAAGLGTLFVDLRGRLHLTNDRADALMLDTLREIGAGRSTGRSIALNDNDRRPRVLHIVPVRGRANDLFIDGAALLVLTNPQNALKIDSGVLAELFDLTPAEARVAALVCQGEMRLPKVAEALGVSVNTIRTHLQAVFNKTGARRQLDLARLLIATTAF